MTATNPIPLIRMNTILPFVDFLNGLGSPTEHLLKQAKLPIFALNDLEALIPRHQVFQFAQKAASREGIENLGLLVGQQTSIVNLGAFGRLICQSLTLYDAFHTIIRIAPANNSGELYWLKEQGSKTWFCQQYVNLFDNNCLDASLYSLMMIIDLIRMVLGREWRPKEIYLQSHQTRGLTENELLGNTKIHAGVGFTGVAFPRYFLSLPLLCRFCHKPCQQDEQILTSSAPKTDFSGSLQQTLATLLRDGYPDIHIASEIAQMSVRTFQRRLAEQGLTYSRLVEQTRFDLAFHFLQDPTIKLIDIAAELGYTDAAHFTRAFKRWTGISPREFRHQGVYT